MGPPRGGHRPKAHERSRAAGPLARRRASCPARPHPAGGPFREGSDHVRPHSRREGRGRPLAPR
ncbi:hypothetical protein B5F84_05830 [Olsenella sp. An290]|nr:hypothetical protein B5F84_05830 [Olsenella sp. An290]